MKSELLSLLSILLLTLPVSYHLYNDRNGEKPDQKAGDIILVSAIALVAAVIGLFISNKPIIDELFLAWGIHFFVFDYAINYILYKRGVIENHNWFSHLGKSYTDDILRQFTPNQRLILKSSVLVVTIIIYIIK